MKQGAVKAQLAGSLAGADRVYCYAGGVNWNVAEALAPLGDRVATHQQLASLVDDVLAAAHAGDHVLVMSNGGFGGIHDILLQRLALKAAAA